MNNLFLYFTPIIAQCNQGQRKEGVKFGGNILYEKLLFSAFISPPAVISHEKFNATGYQDLYQMCSQTNYPLVLGGDHSIGTSTVMGSVGKFGDGVTVIWIDAHADINTYEKSISKNKHGMPVAMCVGLDKFWWEMENEPKLSFENLIYVGIRDLDDFEKEVLRENNIKVFSPQQAVDFINQTSQKIHISFDVDGLDPSQMDSTGTIASDGLEWSDVRKIIEASLLNDKLVALDVVEFNPELGNMEKSLGTMKKIFFGEK